MLIDDTASGTTFNGGVLSSYGMPVFVSAGGYTGNTTAHSFLGTVINLPFATPLGTVADTDQGRVIVSGVKSNAPAGGSLLVGSGIGIGALVISGSDLPNVVFRPWNSAARAATRIDAASTLVNGL